MKGFKYQITVLLCKYKINGDKEYASVYFNSATKTVINSDEYMLDKSFHFYTEQIIGLMKDLVG